MNITSTDFSKLEKVIKSFQDKNETELEVVIWGENFKNNTIFHNNFVSVINYFKDTLGIEPERKYCLSLKTFSSNIRSTIIGMDHIKEFWLRNNLSDLDVEHIKKRNISRIDFEEYSIRFNFNEESRIDESTKNTNIDRILDKDEKKFFRLKDVISFRVGSFRIDCSTVKQCNGKTFRGSGCLKAIPIYEIEVELIDKGGDIKDIIDEYLGLVGNVITLLQDSVEIISLSESNNVLNEYKKLVNIKSNNKNNRKNFIAVNAVSLGIENLLPSSTIVNILTDYAVTYKADGERHLLFVNKKGETYLIDINLKVKKVDLKIDGWNNTLIEGEYFSDLNLFLTYDILFSKGEDVRKRHLNAPLSVKSASGRKLTRIELLQAILKDTTSDILEMKVKPYKYGNNDKIFEESKELWNNRESLEYPVDGLIFTPIKEHYPSKLGTWKSLFKWKPPLYNSIDFLIKVVKTKDGRDKVSPFVDTSGKDTKILNYKTLELYVGVNADKFNKGKKSWSKSIRPGKFNPEGNNSNAFCYAKILTEPNGKIMTEDPETKERDEIQDDTIVEFGYDTSVSDFNWKPIRVRYDKTEKYKRGEPVYGNFETVANDNWNKIMKPVTEYMITSGDIEVAKNYYKNTDIKKFNSKLRLEFQKFHNQYVKTKLIESVSVSKTSRFKGELLDLSSGKGGDLPKWKRAKFKKVIGLDIDKEGIRYAMEFYKTYPKPKPNVYYVWADSSKLIFPKQEAGMDDMNKLRLAEYIPKKESFDVVSSQFSLHYFFESKKKLENLLQNVSDNLKKGGYYIGTCFDGKRVFEALGSERKIEGMLGDDVIWSITKRYRIKKFVESKPHLGVKIDVYVASIGSSHIEYLVNFKYLEKMALKYKLKLVKIEPFGELYKQMEKNGNKFKMSEDEKRFSFLSSTFKFQKM